MVRAILIDPVEGVVSYAVVPDNWADIRRKFEMNKLVRVATLPKGDNVYVAEEEKDSKARFRLGGSKILAGYGLVVGKRGDFGLICDALTSADDVASLTEFNPT